MFKMRAKGACIFHLKPPAFSKIQLENTDIFHLECKRVSSADYYGTKKYFLGKSVSLLRNTI